jgi:hypothetical protein
VFAVAVLVVGCTLSPPEPESFCKTEGPGEKVPEVIGKIYRGMSKAEVDHIFGEQGYMPTAGQYNYVTGGDCQYELGHFGPCSLVLEWRRVDARLNITYLHGLETCWWGGIGE